MVEGVGVVNGNLKPAAPVTDRAAARNPRSTARPRIKWGRSQGTDSLQARHSGRPSALGCQRADVDTNLGSSYTISGEGSACGPTAWLAGDPVGGAVCEICISLMSHRQGPCHRLQAARTWTLDDCQDVIIITNCAPTAVGSGPLAGRRGMPERSESRD